jgi:hypothetical protein
METALHISTPGPSRGLHYHASTQTSCAIVLQRDNQDHTMIDNSTRDTDILIDQYMIDSELTNKEVIRTKRWIISRGSAVT